MYFRCDVGLPTLEKESPLRGILQWSLTCKLSGKIMRQFGLEGLVRHTLISLPRVNTHGSYTEVSHDP